MSLPDPAPVTNLIDAFRWSKTMFTAVALGIFDILHDAPADLAALAERTHTQPAALERLLDACASLGFLAKDVGQYRNQPVADVYLTRDSQHTLTGYIEYSDTVLYNLWAHLDDALREGSHRWRQSFGLDDPLFSAFFRDDQAMRSFMRGMHGFGLLSSPTVVTAFDLSRFRRLVDLGGGTGHLAIAACEHYPDLRGAVFDLPAVMTVAREAVSQSPAAARIELLEGDFFADPLPPADLYSLGRVLHDWSEPKIKVLLGKIRAALPAGGAVLIAERLLDEAKTGPLNATMQSLNMLVCTEGRERNLAEYEALLHSAGFPRVEARITGTPLDAVMGWT